RLWAVGVHWDAHGGGAVALRERQIYWRFIARDEAAVAVRRRRSQRKEGRRVRQKSTNKEARHLGNPGVASGVGEEWLFVLPETHMDVHAGTVVAEDRLGHEGDGFADGAS